MNERIHTIAQKEIAVNNLQTLYDSVKSLREGSQERADAYKAALEKMVAEMKVEEEKRVLWDFSCEKEQQVFVRDEVVSLRPVMDSDADFYVKIRMQYSMIYRVTVNVEKHRSEGLFRLDTCQPECFYCIIENASGEPIGYLGIKDTSKEIWEIAIELDKDHTHKGFGSRSIKLFLNEIRRITGRTLFSARIEADNTESQGCFEKLGAELVGLSTGPLLLTDQEKENFEEKHPELITDQIRLLANRMGVEPRKLLSHVLEYHIVCPL